MKRRVLVLVFAVAFVMLTIVAVQASSLATPPSPGTGESFGSVQNTGTAVANAVVTYYNLNGTIAATKAITIAPKATQGIAPRLLDGTSQALPSGYVGSVVVSADQDVVAVSYINWTGADPAFGPDGKTSADFNGVNVPSTSLFFPSARNTDDEATEVTIQNADSTPAVAYLNYYDRNGVLIAAARQTSAAIPVGSQATFKLVNNAGLPAGFLGSVYVTSTNQIAGVAIVYWTVSHGTLGYNAEPGTSNSTSLYFPKVERRSTTFDPTPGACSSWYDSSGVVAQNMSTSAAADVRVSFYDRTGALVTAFNDSIPVLSSHGYNTQFNGNAPVANMNALGCNFLGSVVITSTGAPIVGIHKYADTADGWADAYNGIAPSTGGNSLYYPFFYHTDPAYTPAPGTPSTWAQYTGLIVQNVDTVPVDVYVNVLSRDGTTVLASIKDPTQLGPGISHGYNSRYGGNLPASTFGVLPQNFTGGAYITSTGKVIGVMSTWNPVFGGDILETDAFAR